jgi:hypothetical protein
VTRRRGRPAEAVFDAPLRARYLKAVAAGARLGEAAEAFGIHRNLPGYHALRDEEFARAFNEAKALGKKRRGIRHGEVAYNEGRCRCTEICTPAATAARARRHATQQPEDDDAADPPTAAPDEAAAAPSSPLPFSLRSPLVPSRGRAA